MFKNAKIGDKVYCLTLGWGIITNINKSIDYPLIVMFNETQEYNFSIEGKNTCYNPNPILFWNKVIIEPPPEPLDIKEIEEKIDAYQISTSFKDPKSIELSFIIKNIIATGTSFTIKYKTYVRRNK